MSYGGGAKCPACAKTVYFAEELVAEGQKWHKTCFKCTGCNKPLSSTSMASHEQKLYCIPCHTSLFGAKGSHSMGSTVFTKVEGGQAGASNHCPRCGNAVYMAEKIVGAGQMWHKECFNCADCRKKLDSTTVSDNEGQIYCKGCYGKNFGPKGVGYGQGAGTLTMTSGATESVDSGAQAFLPPAPVAGTAAVAKGANTCPRCGLAVYMAEKIVGAGSSWHKACFKCSACGKKLDSTTVADKDGEIYCKACYGKQFGPKGFGFGQGAGTLTMT
ncbi:hypothetical protein EMCRGX_G023737 [Ephydatia muelleri]